jgi:hypothetical protein
MGYYIRLLTTSKALIPADILVSALTAAGLSGNVAVEGGSTDSWTSLVLTDARGAEVAEIDRSVVSPGSLAAEELSEFEDELVGAKPASAVRWVRDYFKKVRTVYAFRLLSGSRSERGAELYLALLAKLRAELGGIGQADGEGFSNEEGFHIIWQFSDEVSGPWKAAVLDKSGRWIPFEMDLGNAKHREAFKAGKVPESAKKL